MSKPILSAILSCTGTHLTDEEKYLFSSSNPLGVTLFARNVLTKEQTRKLVEDIKNAITTGDDNAIMQFFGNAKQYRDSLK